ncbi:hypothetical protein A9X02_12460 [Mycobacterium malmoense]|nr:hypothetical protein A9X02_12460 [Mycobacterium malmoense]
METVLGVSMTPAAVHAILVEGEHAEGATVDTDTFDVSRGRADPAGPDQVVSAILGTRQGATESGCPLASVGVTWTDPTQAAALRDLLADQRIDKIMLVSAFLAAAALTQTVGSATRYAHTALLFVEPSAATMAVVDTGDGSVADVRRQALPDDDQAAVEAVTALAAGAEAMEPRPDGLFVVGSDGVDVATIRMQLEAATSLVVSTPEEPELALARGAALASAHPPLFSSSTAAIAYAQDPAAGAGSTPAAGRSTPRDSRWRRRCRPRTPECARSRTTSPGIARASAPRPGPASTRPSGIWPRRMAGKRPTTAKQSPMPTGRRHWPLRRKRWRTPTCSRRTGRGAAVALPADER